MEDYKWSTDYEHANNETTMDEYLSFHLDEEFDVIFQDGTYAEIKNLKTGAIWACHASGDGDFRHHKIRFEFIH